MVRVLSTSSLICYLSLLFEFNCKKELIKVLLYRIIERMARDHTLASALAQCWHGGRILSIIFVTAFCPFPGTSPKTVDDSTVAEATILPELESAVTNAGSLTSPIKQAKESRARFLKHYLAFYLCT